MTTNHDPLPPLKSTAALFFAPALLTGLFLAAGNWNIPSVIYGALTAMLLMALCGCSPAILAFPKVARSELAHRLELARCAGTSWFADMRAAGRCSLLEIGEEGLRASQLCRHYAVSFATAAALYVALGLAAAAGGIGRWFSVTGTVWALAVSLPTAVYFGWITMRYRAAEPIAPDKKDVLDAANLHQLCDQERRTELMGFIRKSA